MSHATDNEIQISWKYESFWANFGIGTMSCAMLSWIKLKACILFLFLYPNFILTQFPRVFHTSTAFTYFKRMVNGRNGMSQSLVNQSSGFLFMHTSSSCTWDLMRATIYFYYCECFKIWENNTPYLVGNVTKLWTISDNM